MGVGERTAVENADTFLRKRDGIDKLLKIVRYSSKLSVWYHARSAPELELVAKLRSLDSNLGTTRKALRIGKFLGNVTSIQKELKNEDRLDWVSILNILTDSVEGIYYFLEQINFLLKVGIVHKSAEQKLTKFTAVFELLGYMGLVAQQLLVLQSVEETLKSKRQELKSLFEEQEESRRQENNPLRECSSPALSRLNRSASGPEGMLVLPADLVLRGRTKSIDNSIQSPRRKSEFLTLELQELNGGNQMVQRLRSNSVNGDLIKCEDLAVAINGLSENKQHGSSAAVIEMLQMTESQRKLLEDPQEPNGEGVESHPASDDFDDSGREKGKRCSSQSDDSQESRPSTLWSNTTASNTLDSVEVEGSSPSRAPRTPRLPILEALQFNSGRIPSGEKLSVLSEGLPSPFSLQSPAAYNPAHLNAAKTRRRSRLSKCQIADQLDQNREALESECARLESKRRLVQLVLLQTFGDSLCAIGELRGESSKLSHPVFVSVCGILSALISVYCKWGS